jgi:hypothetical protein
MPGFFDHFVSHPQEDYNVHPRDHVNCGSLHLGLGDAVAVDAMPTDIPCMLSIAQEEVMTKVIEQHVAVQLLQAFNSSCAYNVTISAAGVVV